MLSETQKKQEMDAMKRKSDMAKRMSVGLAVFCAVLLTGCGAPGEKDEEQKIEQETEQEAGQTEQQSHVDNAEADAEGENLVSVIESDESRETDGVEEETDGNEEAVAKPEPKARPEGFELVLESEDWGLGFGEPETQPRGNASAEDLAWYHAYYLGDDSEKVLYLTFDCGYENGNTEPILDALKKHNAPATFFVVGHFLETEPELVKRMVEEGHAVGNHTYHHLDMASISDMESFGNEVNDVAQLFQEITGKELSPYYRPPQGKCNVRNLEMAEELGYYTIFWSLAYVDWNQDNQPSHEEAFDKLTTRVHPGAVVLLHNTSNTNGEILDELLTKWEGMGYSFKPLSELVSKE